jgi:DNA polymerase-3 subunit epsilon
MYLWIDVESTGIMARELPAHAPGQPRLCSIAMLFVNRDLEITAEHEWLIKPHGWFLEPDSEAAKVNGLIHEELVAKGVPIKHILPIYSEAIEERRIIGGHNISHDVKLMRGELRRAEMEDLYMKTRTICSMQSSRKIVGAVDKNGKAKAPRLEEACAYFGIPLPEKHRAMADAKGSLEVMRKLRAMGQDFVIGDPYEKQRKKGEKSRTSAPAPEEPAVDDKDLLL